MTLAGCRALSAPHAPGARRRRSAQEMAELAELAGALLAHSAGQSHAKAGNINAALPRTAGDSSSSSTPTTCRCPTRSTRSSATSTTDAMALVQRRTTSTTTTRSSTTRSAATSSASSIGRLPGRDRHGAAFLVRLGGALRREALLRDRRGRHRDDRRGLPHDDPPAAPRLGRRYHDEVLIQGLAPHDLDGYLLQRDRWARGNLAVFTRRNAAPRPRAARSLQRLSYLPACSPTWRPPMRAAAACLHASAWCCGRGSCR